MWEGVCGKSRFIFVLVGVLLIFLGYSRGRGIVLGGGRAGYSSVLILIMGRRELILYWFF